MPIPPALKASVDHELTAYCEEKIPERVRDRVRLTHAWDGNKVTLIEQRPRWNDLNIWTESPIAQFAIARAQPGRMGPVIPGSFEPPGLGRGRWTVGESGDEQHRAWVAWILVHEGVQLLVPPLVHGMEFQPGPFSRPD